MRDPRDPTERVTRTDRVERTDRAVDQPAGTAAPGVTSPQTNVNVAGTTRATATNAYGPVWGVARVVTLIFTVIEILLLLRFILRFAGANADQQLVATLYSVTEPLTRPFQGIFATPTGTPVFDLPALLAILFFFLIGAFIVALVRAIAGRAAA